MLFYIFNVLEHVLYTYVFIFLRVFFHVSPFIKSRLLRGDNTISRRNDQSRVRNKNIIAEIITIVDKTFYNKFALKELYLLNTLFRRLQICRFIFSRSTTIIATWV